MYIVKICNGEPETLLVNTKKELQQIINLSTESDYEIVEVSKFDYTLGRDFINELKNEIKPKNLEYGKGD